MMIELPEYNLRIDHISGPGGMAWAGIYYIVVDGENEERGTLYGPTRDKDRAYAFIAGYYTAVSWVEEMGERWMVDEDLCVCGHDVEDHNDVWKRSTKCHRCDCTKWSIDVYVGWEMPDEDG